MAKRDTTTRTTTPDDVSANGATPSYKRGGATPDDLSSTGATPPELPLASGGTTGNGMIDAMHTLADKLHPVGR